MISLSWFNEFSKGQRDENQEVDSQQVKEDAQSLYIAGG